MANFNMMNNGYDRSQGRYGRGRQPMMNDPTSPWQQQEPDPANDPRFRQSKSLRDHIVECLNEQLQCLQQATQRVGSLRDLGINGQRAASGRGPGDEQISAGTIANMKWGQAFVTRSPAYDALYGSTGPAGLDSYRGRTQPFGITNPWLSMGMQSQSTNKKGKQKEAIAKTDPIVRYQELEGEILSLMAMSSVQEQQNQDNPYQAMADKVNLMAKATTNPRQALDDRMAKIIGPGDGSGGFASPSTAASTPAQIMAAPQQQYGYPQAAPQSGGGGTLEDFPNSN